MCGYGCVILNDIWAHEHVGTYMAYAGTYTIHYTRHQTRHQTRHKHVIRHVMDTSSYTSWTRHHTRHHVTSVPAPRNITSSGPRVTPPLLRNKHLFLSTVSSSRSIHTSDYTPGTHSRYPTCIPYITLATS